MLGLKHHFAQLVARPADDLEAYQLYLRGREASHQRSRMSLQRTIEFYRQALARDAKYARAHWGLAEAYIGLGVSQYITCSRRLITYFALRREPSREHRRRGQRDAVRGHTRRGLR